MKNLYRDWPDEHLASELFAMRRAILAHPEDASRWTRRLELVEREARRRRPKRRRLPLGQRIAQALVGDRDQDGRWVDWQDGARLVVVDDNGVFWGLSGEGTAHLLNIFRPGHLACIVRSLRSSRFIATEWEYLVSADSAEAGA